MPQQKTTEEYPSLQELLNQGGQVFIDPDKYSKPSSSPDSAAKAKDAQAKYDQYANQDSVSQLPQYLRTFASEALDPYSAADASGNMRVPPAVAGIPQMFGDFLMGKGASGIARTLQGIYGSLQKTGSEDPLTRAEGYGQLASPFVIPAGQATFGRLAGGVASGMRGTMPTPEPPPLGGQYVTKGTPTATSGRFMTGAPAPQPPPIEPAPIDAPYTMRYRVGAPASPSGISGTAPSRALLPPGQGEFIPGGGTIPIEPEGPLPAHYSKMPAETQPSQPGTFGMNRNMEGQTGGIPARGEQTVTPTRLPHIAVNDAKTGRFRKMTNAEYKSFLDRIVSERSNIGKGQTPPPRRPPKRGNK